jgi:hypothetical protein
VFRPVEQCLLCPDEGKARSSGGDICGDYKRPHFFAKSTAKSVVSAPSSGLRLQGIESSRLFVRIVSEHSGHLAPFPVQ